MELADYIDAEPGWNSSALRNVVRRWEALEPGDPFWYALGELASDGYHGGFDTRLRQSIIQLLVAADKAAAER